MPVGASARALFITARGLLKIMELIRDRNHGPFKLGSKLDLTSQPRAGEGKRGGEGARERGSEGEREREARWGGWRVAGRR